MTYNPKIFIQVSCILTVVVTCLCFFLDQKLAEGVFFSSSLLTLNLAGWIWGIKTFVEIVREGSSSALFTLFMLTKFVLLTTSLLLVYLFFGPLGLLVGNSIVVMSLLLPSLYLVLNQSKGLSNEC